MSGHSKWSTIKRQKGITDAKRGQVFTKMAMAITLATKLGGSGDLNSNPRLRFALNQAKGVNMPKDNIERAIERGLGKGKEALEEVTYEGFGPPAGGGKIAYLVEGVTDNKLRTLQEIKNLFERSGGSLAGQGSTAYMFDKIGEIKVTSKGGDKDSEMLELIDLGVEDVEDDIQGYLVYVESPQLNTMSIKLTHLGYGVESCEIVYKPNTTVLITDPDMAKKVVEFAQKLADHPDIQGVYDNLGD